jgi:hypothetical protein
VEVRRAIPVERSFRESEPIPLRERPRIDARGRMTEQHFVERLPDGRLRTMIIRRRAPSTED